MIPTDLYTVTMGVALTHCGQPMVWRGGHTTWLGRPGDGFEINNVDFRCASCSATATLTAKEPC